MYSVERKEPRLEKERAIEVELGCCAKGLCKGLRSWQSLVRPNGIACMHGTSSFVVVVGGFVRRFVPTSFHIDMNSAKSPAIGEETMLMNALWMTSIPYIRVLKNITLENGDQARTRIMCRSSFLSIPFYRQKKDIHKVFCFRV